MTKVLAVNTCRVFAIFVLALSSPSGWSQIMVSPPNPSMAGIALAGQANSMVSRHLIRSGPNLFSAQAPASAARATPAGASIAQAFSFSRSAEVSRSVRTELSRSFAGTENSAMVPVIQSGAPWKEFDRLIGTYGYSGTNLIDVMTAYYVITYEVANGRDESKNIEGIRAVHDQLAAALSRNAALGSLSDSEKQRTAEEFAYIAIMAAASQNEMVKRGQQDQLPALRDSVYRTVMAQGVDLRNLVLTRQGFVQKSQG